MKIFWILALVGFFCVAGVTAWLAALNWSERLWMPLIAALLTGLATGFFSILSTSKETSNRETFITSVLINADGTSPIVIAEDYDFLSRLSSIGGLLTQWRQSNANQLFDQFNDVLAAEQYYVARLVSEIQSGGFGVLTNRGVPSAHLNPDPPLENTVELSVETIANIFAGNPFFDLRMEHMYWEFPRFHVPPGTKISLSHTPSSQATGSEKRGIRLYKKLYFDWRVTLEPVGGTIGLPRGVELLGEGQPVPNVVFTKVTVSSTFGRFTAGNRHTKEYMEWTAWLTQQLKAKLSAGT
jgi:hypothetical protein